MDNSARLDDRPTVTLLSLSRFEEDHLALVRIFQDSKTSLYPGLRVAIARAWEPADAVTVVRASRIPIVICDADQFAGGWQQMALELRCVPEAPCLILASSVVDDRLGAEASRHGAYDVLAKPLCAAEVLRMIKMAWLRWQHKHRMTNPESETQTGDSAGPETGGITKEKP